MSDIVDQIESDTGESTNGAAEQPTASDGQKKVRMEVVMSDGGENYDVLPLPSGGIEEFDSGGGALADIGFKPLIPYMAVYSSPSRILVGLASAYLLKTKVVCKVMDVKRDIAYRHPLNPYLYTIEITHGQFTWTVYKRYKHFVDLHEKLWAYRASLKLPIPSKRHKEKRKSRHRLSKEESKIPWFPRKPEVWVSTEELDKRKNQLEQYLNAVLESRLYRNQNATKRFIEVSRISFIQDLGVKGKEGIVKKRSGGHKIKLDLCAKCCNITSRELFAKWRNRWLVVKDTFVAYLGPDQDKIKGVLLFDSLITILHRNPSSKLVISNSSRSLKVNCWTDRQALEWKKAIENCINNRSAGLSDPDIRFQSFGPIREDSLAHWFVDGRTYFDALADAMEEAKEEIFITDWWLSPEIYLKRPITHGDYWRLDMVLKRKAAQGVKIYVQLYKEVEVAVGLDSAYTKRTLMKLHSKNIRVMRHPDISPGESLLWAHHEKIAVIDQVVAFVGGIDLCYGRWDDQDHKLTDVGSPASEAADFAATDGPSGEGKTATAPAGPSTTGMVFGMFGAMTMGVVSQVSKDQMPEKEIAPPSNGSAGSKKGDKIKRFLSKAKKEQSTPDDDPGESPIKREGSALATTTFTGYGSVDEYTPLVGEESDSRKMSSKDSANGKSTSSTKPDGKQTGEGSLYLEKYKAMVSQVEQASQARLWIGKDYNNFILKDLTNLDDPFEDEIDRYKVPRMPWHDIACVTYGKAARDVARHFIQRWNFTKIQKAKKGEHITFLLPKTYSEDLIKIPEGLVLPEAVRAKVQIIRSSCEWSAGVSVVDRSIQNAYLYAIEKSQHFIYIENQFFISCRGHHQVRNTIAEALYQRIIQAHRKQQNFKVYVVMPLVPGFEGDISDQKKSQAIRTVLHWQYKSICRGTGSLMEDLSQAIGQHNTSKYISFCGLRTHSKLNGKPITEMIYVHSKMLIVDDRLVIIGSANINDRSMTGQRDSEVAMLVEDTEFVAATLGGKEVEVGKYAAALRRRCFCEHLGLLPQDYDGTHATFDPLTHQSASEVEDVASDHFFKDVWTKTAAVNTTVHEKVFKCFPSDYIRTLSQIHDFQKDPLCEVDVEAAEKELDKVKGYLVLLPLHFLTDEDLTPDVMTKEAIAPTDLWT